MRKTVLISVADGSEEMETIIPADVLRRSGAEVTLASVDGLSVTASRGIKIVADKLISECNNQAYDLIVVPGGMPGSEHLRDSAILGKMLQEQADAKRLIGAICAAPVIVLQHYGLLQGKFATCHPHHFAELQNLKQDYVVVDGNFITSQGPGTAVLFALKLVEMLFDKSMANKVATSMVVPEHA